MDITLFKNSLSNIDINVWNILYSLYIAFTEITLVHIAIGVHRVKPPINSKKKMFSSVDHKPEGAV